MFSFSFKSLVSSLTLGVAAISFVSVSGFAQSNSVILAKVVSSGDLVSINTYNSVLNLRNAPCGQIIATVPSMGTGMVAQDIKNNTKMMCNGGNWTWVKVNFANASGFVAAEYLLKMDPKIMPKMETSNNCKGGIMRLDGVCYNKKETPQAPGICGNGFSYDSKSEMCYRILNDYTSPKPGEKVEPAKMPTVNMGNIWVTGSKVHVHTVMVPIQVRDTPCGTRKALAWPGAVGTLMNNDKNFVKATCNGGTFSWVDVDFGGGARGWVAKEYLKSSVNI
jgi:hypothetical protein